MKIYKYLLAIFGVIVLTGIVSVLIPKNNLVTNNEKIVRFDGTVEVVFTDCVSSKKLNSRGEIETTTAVSCDGGSHVVVDGRSIQTATGLVPEEYAFNKHDEDLNPGDRVSVVAVRESNDYMSLNCSECRITKK